MLTWVIVAIIVTVICALAYRAGTRSGMERASLAAAENARQALEQPRKAEDDQRGQQIYESVLVWMSIRPSVVATNVTEMAKKLMNDPNWESSGALDLKTHVYVQLKIALEQVPDFYDKMLAEAKAELAYELKVAEELGRQDFFNFTVTSNLRKITGKMLNEISAEAHRLTGTSIPPPRKFWRSEWPGGKNDPDRYLAAME